MSDMDYRPKRARPVGNWSFAGMVTMFEVSREVGLEA
jgi:hypothetical protein